MEIFIEKGTGIGKGIDHALTFDFKKLFSIEIDEVLYKQTKEIFSDKRLRLINGTPERWLKEILRNKAKEANRILFWLDAHFPGADFGIRSYTDSMKMGEAVSIPLEVELRTIAGNRDISNDVFIMDDLRIYDSGNYRHGNYDQARKMFPGSGTDFIYSILSETHQITKDYRREGYIIANPIRPY